MSDDSKDVIFQFVIALADNEGIYTLQSFDYDRLRAKVFVLLQERAAGLMRLIDRNLHSLDQVSQNHWAAGRVTEDALAEIAEEFSDEFLDHVASYMFEEIELEAL